MVEYKKYMFDNFVITEEKPTIPDPDDVALDAEEAADVADIKEELSEVEEDTNEYQMFSSEEVVEIKEISAEDVQNEDEKEVSKEKDRINSDVKYEEAEISYSQEELDAAVNAAETKGYEKGFNTAVSEQSQAEATLLENINNRLMTVLADISTQNTAQEQAALQFAIAVVKKLLPSLEEQVAAKEVETFIRNNFKNFANEGSLSFQFNPAMVKEIAPKISRLAEQNDFEGKIAIHKDEALALSDCRIEWQNGGVERNNAKILSQIDELLN